MNRTIAVVMSFALSAAATAGNPELTDFALGLAVDVSTDAPMQELMLPDMVYGTVLRADLGDLRVFNSAGIVVPHTLCTGPAPSSPGMREQTLAVFALQGAGPLPADGARVDVQTSGGTSVRIQEPSLGSSAAGAGTITAYVIDAHGLKEPLRALRLSWSSEDGASEVAVRVETSDDLDSWRTVVDRTTLLRTAGDGGVLERMLIKLPVSIYGYLRLERSDGGPPPRLEQVTAEVVTTTVETQPRRFPPAPLATIKEHEYLFDSERLAPVHWARVRLPTDNMTLRVALDSRVSPETQWQPRWQGDVFSISAAEDQQISGIRFSPVPDREWRLRILRGAETLGAARPSLELGYHPARLRFLVQGAAPYLLAFGSARVPLAQIPGCDSLLGELSPGERARLLGQATTSPAPMARFGGTVALVPQAKPTPVRLIVLWAVLIFGTALLVAMAVALIRRLRSSGIS